MYNRLFALIGFSALASTPAAFAATPASGTVSDSNANVAWQGASPPVSNTGGSTCTGPNDSACDNFSLTISPPQRTFDVNITIVSAGPNDCYYLSVFNAAGTRIAGPQLDNASSTSVTLHNPVAGAYTVSVAQALDQAAITATCSGAVLAYSATAQIPPASSGGTGNGTEPLRFATYSPNGLTEPDAHWAQWAPAYGTAGLGTDAGEPSLGIPVKNNITLQTTGNKPNISHIMYLANLQTLRLEVNSVVSPAIGTWFDKSSPTAKTTLDAFLWVDRITGRTISTQLAGKRSIMSLSDDDGETWNDSPQGAGINAGADHQAIGSGPFPASDTIGGLNGYTTATYYASQDVQTAEAALSRDGGTTWGAAVPMYVLAADCAGVSGAFNGRIAVGPDGTVYIPGPRNCNGGAAGIAVSSDAGTSYQFIQVPYTSQASSSDSSVAVAKDNTVYFTRCEGDTKAIAMVSHDHGSTWTQPIDVGAPLSLKECVFASVIAGDGDRAAIAWFGSTTSDGGTGSAVGPNPTAFTGVWYLFISATYDGGATWTTVLASPDGPIQRGAICRAGTTCAGARNLLDFIDMDLDEMGRIYVGWDDGCIGSCKKGGNNSGTNYTRISRQEPGSRSLYAVNDSLFRPGSAGGAMSVAPLQPYLEAFLTGSSTSPTATVNWAKPWDGQSPITRYEVYRRQNPGTYGGTPLATITDTSVLTYVDGTVVPGNQYCYLVQAWNVNGGSPKVYENCAVPLPIMDPCNAPFAMVGQDTSGDQTGAPANSQLDYQQLFLGEPFVGNPTACSTPSAKELRFDLTVGDASTTAANNTWAIVWNRSNQVPDSTGQQTIDREMVNMRITATGPECHIGHVTAASVNQGTDYYTLPAADCGLTTSSGIGHISIKVPTDQIDDCPNGATGCIGAGYSVSGLDIRTFNSNASGQPITQASSNDHGGGLNYTLIGNDACRPHAAPIANDDTFLVNLDAANATITPQANDTINDCGTVTITKVDPPTSGNVVINGDNSVTYTPSNAFVCQDRFMYTITDSLGATTSSALISIYHNQQDAAGPADYIYADRFEGGHICPKSP